MSEQVTIEETEKEIVEEFSLFDSWDDKYEYIIDLGIEDRLQHLHYFIS